MLGSKLLDRIALTVLFELLMVFLADITGAYLTHHRIALVILVLPCVTAIIGLIISFMTSSGSPLYINKE